MLGHSSYRCWAIPQMLGPFYGCWKIQWIMWYSLFGSVPVMMLLMIECSTDVRKFFRWQTILQFTRINDDLLQVLRGLHMLGCFTDAKTLAKLYTLYDTVGVLSPEWN
ncbi:hypothetical protein LSH36_31g09025 [Paralvinella palmiformis]|uniref:Uncharacterized protein n=1 Tax=Paralvinella palmiformis TaxID=53620 RepID=A0AAD9NEF2_9ANNE|nr:hypothetical protein LSH36_31g09025 [Paralvinella palmiformis]